MTTPIAIDHKHILDRIASGEYVPAIAKELGITKQALAIRLATHHRDEYIAARETAADLRLDGAVMMIEGSQDHLDLARARELFRAVSWRAEREHPNRWGSRPSVAIQANGEGLVVNVVSFLPQPATQQSSDSTE